ncbi:unnamed protein product [Vitrella brassicaformis CCMP3155]|uniref:Uncharacterized protein n=2 Tax=Vitrella brassicaformis TaxID=1169539 RepID=A0A0G4H6M8_VITBC|nr:unnamed protein product [Vitrella brassicaformis CCMP3155]|eukprot:CEM39400.1 unnamed protein product [Vitrella brassicaformis CCMP3155]
MSEARTTVSCVVWVPRGVAKAVPRQYEMTDEEEAQLKTLMEERGKKAAPSRSNDIDVDNDEGNEWEDVNDDDDDDDAMMDTEETNTAVSKKATQRVSTSSSITKKAKAKAKAAAAAARLTGRATGADDEFDMEHYEDEEDDDDQYGKNFFSVLDSDLPLAQNDPNIRDEEDSDADEDVAIRPNQDLILVAASAERDFSVLEVYVYDPDALGFFVHHDIMVGSYPLCLEWLSQAPTKAAASTDGAQTSSNLVAVGSFEPQIEIWDLDVLNAMEPLAVLGGGATKKKKGGGAGKGHKGAIMCLNANKMQRHIMCSGSTDETVKVWDIEKAACVHTYTHHTDKVQCVRWHPIEQPVLLSAAYDKSVAVLDVRVDQSGTKGGQGIVRAPLSADSECAVWDRHHPTVCMVSTEDGFVTAYDIRQLKSDPIATQTTKKGRKAASGAGSEPLWRLHAHHQAASGITDAAIADMLVTCSVDGAAKVWNRADPQSDGSPSLVFEKDLKAGKLFCCSANSDVPSVVSFGGSVPVVWDVSTEQAIREAFHIPE